MSYGIALEWIFTGVWTGDLYKFIELDTNQQARFIAAYRIERQGEAVLAKEQANEMKRRSRSKASG